MVKLKWKVFGFLALFCALLLSILWLFQTVFLEDMYKSIRKQELNTAIAEVERNLNSPDFMLVVERIQAEKDITVSLTPEFVFTPYRVTASRNARIPEFLTEVKEYELENGWLISLTYHALLTPVNATVSTLRLQLYIITAIMIILATFLAIIIAKRVSKPIEEINKSAAVLARGDYDVRFSGSGFYEIVELSQTLNTAAYELGRAEELRRELLANVSHDLRTPLALIYSYAEMMSDFPDEITAEQTKTLMEESQRLTTLVNDALDLSKLESDMDYLNRSEFNLTENIAQTVRRTEELLKSKGFKIGFDYADELNITADETKINRAFYNLLINAINYSGESRDISVSQVVKGDCVRISVTDNGQGICAADLPFIWDRYYKSGKAHKRAVTGTGLGLSIVKRIIELHDGDCGAESVQGQGSTFWFELDF